MGQSPVFGVSSVIETQKLPILFGSFIGRPSRRLVFLQLTVARFADVGNVEFGLELAEFGRFGSQFLTSEFGSNGFNSFLL